MNKVANEVRDTETLGARSRLLYRLAGAAALIVGVFLLIGALRLITEVLQPGGTSGWLPALQDNWLIVIFKLHAGFVGVELGLLQSLDFLDIAILALVGTACLGLYAALRRTSRIWSIVAAVQPFLGIVLFVATRTAGRSAAMGAVLVMSLVMLWSRVFKKAIAYLGIVASAFLLVGDFSAGLPPSVIVATLFAIAYLLFIAWFFLIAQRLFQLAQGVTNTGSQ